MFFTGAEIGGSGRASLDAHFSDDESVAKMGHPDALPGKSRSSRFAEG